jgi:hypothetical protein
MRPILRDAVPAIAGKAPQDEAVCIATSTDLILRGRPQVCVAKDVRQALRTANGNFQSKQPR